jgi:AcrR family transcriptional regulator
MEGAAMPPKVSFTREKILREAFEIVREDGLDALSAREIAQRLHCSTRPVYTAFRSMKALEEAVMVKAREYASSYFLQDTDTDSPFLCLGLRYFRFSQEEKELFKLLYLDRRMGITFEKMGEYFSPLLDRMKKDPRLHGVSEAGLKRMGMDSWIYTHGLVALVCAAPPQNAEELIRTYLSRMGKILIMWEQSHDKEAQS